MQLFRIKCNRVKRINHVVSNRFRCKQDLPSQSIEIRYDFDYCFTKVTTSNVTNHRIMDFVIFMRQNPAKSDPD